MLHVKPRVQRTLDVRPSTSHDHDALCSLSPNLRRWSLFLEGLWCMGVCQSFLSSFGSRMGVAVAVSGGAFPFAYITMCKLHL